MDSSIAEFRDKIAQGFNSFLLGEASWSGIFFFFGAKVRDYYYYYFFGFCASLCSILDTIRRLIDRIFLSVELSLSRYIMINCLLIQLAFFNLEFLMKNTRTDR